MVQVISCGVVMIGDRVGELEEDALRCGELLVSRELASLLPRELAVPLVIRHAVGALEGDAADEWRDQLELSRSGEPWAEGAEVRSRFMPALPSAEVLEEGARVFVDNLRKANPEVAEERGEEELLEAARMVYGQCMLAIVKRGGVVASTSEGLGRTALLLEDELERGERVPELEVVGVATLAEAARSLGLDAEELEAPPGEEEEEGSREG